MTKTVVSPRTSRAGKIVPLLVALATIIVFSGVLRNGFTNWDDQEVILANPHLTGLGWANLRWTLTQSTSPNFMPLSWLLFALTRAIWGLDPVAYHLTSVLLHAAVAVVFYHTTVCLLKTAGAEWDDDSEAGLRWSAGLAALLFALHPLRVEVVAWASAQHHELAAIFFLTSIWSYLKSREARTFPAASRRWMIASLAGCALSLLSGPAGMMLPAVLVILDVYLTRRQNGGLGNLDARAVLLEKAPFFVLAAVGGQVSLRGRSTLGALLPLARHGVVERFSQAMFGLSFYIWKTLAPFRLSPLYPMPVKIHPLAWPFLISALFAAAIACLAFAARRGRPAILAACAYYFVTLAPVLGFITYGAQIAADRYTYLPSCGFSVLAAGALTCLWRERGPRAWRNAAILAGVLLGALSFLTWRQVEIWKDSESLCRRAISINPHVTYAENNLGNVLAEQGKLGEAIRHYNLAIQTDPNFAEAYSNLGKILAEQGQMDEAIRLYDAALQLQPDLVSAHNNLGTALVGRGRMDEAIRHYTLAIQANPDHAEAHYNLGYSFAVQGKTNDAIQQYDLALKIRPTLAPAQNNLGAALAGQGNLDEAIRHYTLAIQSKPDYAEAHNNLGITLARQGKSDEAIGQYGLAIRAKPDYAEAHNNLGAALAGQGKINEAIAQFREALRINPGYASARGNLELMLKQLERNR